jgi:hypothetical protein
MKRKTMTVEGAVFLVPLSNYFGVGVLVRADGKGRAYGVFFAPRVATKGDVRISELKPDGGVLRCRFGDQGLHAGRWSVIGEIPSWSRDQWSLPRFQRAHDRSDICYVTEYDDQLNVRAESIVPKSEAEGLPYDAQFGSAIVERKLDELLR